MKRMASSICLIGLVFLIAFQSAGARGPFSHRKKISISALLIFGDSTVDPGNNNHFFTPTKCNFPPYGRDFVGHKATGRFTNGRLVNDILAKQFGVKDTVPAYLDETLKIDDLKTGVSFASSGSGYDPITTKFSNILSIPTQMMYFREYKLRLQQGIGKDQTKTVIDNALFVTSAGTNDFAINYFTLRTRRLFNTLPEYMKFIVGKTREAVQSFVDEGARHIGVVGLPPLGCLPIIISIFSDDPLNNRECIANISSAAQVYNNMLKKELRSMQFRSWGSGVRIAYLDVYTPLDEMISRQKYGFEAVNTGCCGNGLVEAAYMCNQKSLTCADANKYVFWDSVHPTDRAYSVIAQAFTPAIESLFK